MDVMVTLLATVSSACAVTSRPVASRTDKEIPWVPVFCGTNVQWTGASCMTSAMGHMGSLVPLQFHQMSYGAAPCVRLSVRVTEVP